MAAPEKVRLKRKRQEDPLEALILTKTGTSGSELDSTPQKRVRYKLLEKQTPSTVIGKSNVSHRTESPIRSAARRLFRLRRLPQTRHVSTVDAAASLPTFEEQRSQQGNHVYEEPLDLDHGAEPMVQSHKRPGKSSSLGHKKVTMQDVAARKAKSAAEHQQNMQALADLLHEASLEELAKIPKPTSRTKPGLSLQQARVRHERNVASKDGSAAVGDAQMADFADFVYDTYVLVQADDVDDSTGSNVGYLVISKEDEELWQSFMDDEEGQEEEEKDEDDENAESHYAADYPEDDEDGSDEEGEYAYRARQTIGEEEWDHRDEDSDDDDVNQHAARHSARNATVVRKWEKILYGKGASDEDD